MPKQGNTRLSVFKGREAKLNGAIFQTLALKGPQTIYDVCKRLRAFKELRHTHYGSVNKRVRALQHLGYLSAARIKNTRAGFEATEYELTAKTYLALMLVSIKLEDLLSRVNGEASLEILAAITSLT